MYCHAEPVEAHPSVLFPSHGGVAESRGGPGILNQTYVVKNLNPESR